MGSVRVRKPIGNGPVRVQFSFDEWSDGNVRESEYKLPGPRREKDE